MYLINKDKEDLTLLQKAKAKILTEGNLHDVRDCETIKIVLKHFINSKWIQNK